MGKVNCTFTKNTIPVVAEYPGASGCNSTAVSGVQLLLSTALAATGRRR